MAGMYDQTSTPFSQQQTPATQPGSMVPTMNDQQLHLAKLQMAQYHHHQRMAVHHARSAQEAINLHDTLGEQAMRGALNDLMSNGGVDSNYLRSVAQQLRQGGRDDLARIHDDTAEGWD